MFFNGLNGIINVTCNKISILWSPVDFIVVIMTEMIYNPISTVFKRYDLTQIATEPNSTVFF